MIAVENRTQTQQVLDWLRTHEWISPLDALDYFGCFRLGARIYDLKQKGYGIESERWTTPGGASVARYRLTYDPQGLKQPRLPL